MESKRRAESRTRFRLSRNEIAVARGLCPRAAQVSGDGAQVFQLLESPGSRAAIRIVAQRPDERPVLLRETAPLFLVLFRVSWFATQIAAQGTRLPLLRSARQRAS